MRILTALAAVWRSLASSGGSAALPTTNDDESPVDCAEGSAGGAAIVWVDGAEDMLDLSCEGGCCDCFCWDCEFGSAGWVAEVGVDADDSRRSSRACNGGMKSKDCGDGNATAAGDCICGEVGFAAAAASGVDETLCCCDTAETGDLEAMVTDRSFLSSKREIKEYGSSSQETGSG
jgi:hypothetical protein